MTKYLSRAAMFALLSFSACGDDDTSGSAAGRGGSDDDGGIAGHGGSGPCRDVRTKSADVSAWCDTTRMSCDHLLDDHATRVCNLAATAIRAVPNACGGYSLSYAVGVDVYQEVAYYDADRELVGVRVQTCVTCCPELYGKDCGYNAGAGDRLACPDADAGVARWPWTQ